MKCIIYILLLISISYTTIAQKKFNQDPGNPNLDFSAGDFSNWQLSWGNRGAPYTNSGVIAGANSHTIVDIYGTNWDGNAGTGKLKRVPDGLECVARLGAPAGGGYGTPRSYAMKYDITVSATYPILFFQLASIMDITHNNDQNTHYKFSIKSASGVDLLPRPCGGLQLTAKGTASTSSSNVSALPPISAYDLLPTIGSILYQPWESVALDLSSYTGQTITIEYEHSDCYTGHHGSYSYISAAMRSSYDTFYFCRGDYETIIRPYHPNFKSYVWNTGAITDSLVISSPADGAVYTCTVGSYNDCDVTFTYILKELKMDAEFNYVSTGICNQIQFSDQSVINFGNVVKWQWRFGDPASGAANIDTLPNPLHTYPGPGYYTVTLTVTDAFGCTNTVTKTVSVSPEGTIAQIALPYPSCIHATLPFEDITSNGFSRTWYINGNKIDDTAKVIYHSFDLPGIYEITLIAIGSNGCPHTTTQSFQVYDLPKSAIQVLPFTNAAPVTTPEFQFKGFEENAGSYIWNFGYGSSSATGQYTNFSYPPEIAAYEVLLRTYNQYGCYDSSSVIVNIMPPDFIIPSAFSPNGDGANDVFKIINMTNHQLKEFSIYNRYGQQVFLGYKPESVWDGTLNGKLCDAGSYYYLIRYAMPGSGKEYITKGDVTLIR